jgi:16S rRNA A1518/A1519 N6-dimethyltransferase RsmA/KsgA/DIM1 with predicted DNA glycosylase/AP lyase activity
MQIKDQKIFEELVRSLFTQRRRKLRGVFARYLTAEYPSQKEEILERIVQTDKRVYELSSEEFITLSNILADTSNEP